MCRNIVCLNLRPDAIHPGDPLSIEIIPNRVNSPGYLDLSGYYQWSPNLSDWYPSGDGPTGGPIVTATASKEADKIFLRAKATQN